MISLIVATGENRVIGANGSIPWRMPGDMAFFKATTMGKPVIMGRKTWESLPKPLPSRLNIVVTRNVTYQAEGATVVTGLQEALAVAGAAEEAVVIGGAQLYEVVLPLADKAYVTEIHHSFDGDTWFPELDQAQWKLDEEKRFESDEKNPYAYTVRTYLKAS